MQRAGRLGATANDDLESAQFPAQASVRTAFDHIPDAILVHRSGVVVHANLAAATLLGAPEADDLVGRKLRDFYLPSDGDPLGDRLDRGPALQPSSAHLPPLDATMIRLDGRLVDVETTRSSFAFEGKPASLAVIRDVSARREQLARAMYGDRIASVSAIAGGVGHEINNALAFTMTNLEFAAAEMGTVEGILRKSEDAPGKAVAAKLAEIGAILAEAQEGTCRIRDIARDLRTYARTDEDVEAVDLRAAAESALRIATSLMRRRAKVVRHYDEAPLVRASPARLTQILLGVLSNAALAIPEGSHESNEVAVRVGREGQSAFVEIRDTGCGIAPHHRARVFTPFFTTKPAGHGLGLGLAATKWIVDALNGSIELRSDRGTGTTVRILLPAARDKAGASPTTPPPQARRARLLFIDDERLVGAAFKRALAREHDVVVIESAAEALTRLTAAEQFDVVFCDIVMPAMTGVDLYEAIQRTLPHLAERVVMITGGVQSQAARAFIEGRHTPVLEKPLDIAYVRALVAGMLSRADSVLPR